MEKEEIDLVKKSWTYVTTHIHEAGSIFYGILFEKAPEVRNLFKGDMTAQSKKLMTMLSFIVSKLDNLDELTDDIRNLAVRHENYQAKPEYYPLVGWALIETLKTGLGNQWTKEHEKAWTQVYSLLSQTMINHYKK